MPDMNAVTRGFSTRAGRSFGKPGRPAKDAVRERMRIYRAAAPLILRNGVAGTRIRDIARASCLSPGGIYHYFCSKDDLAVYGLHPEALSRACSEAAHDLALRLSDSEPANPRTVVELYVERNLIMLDFVRPALHAAIELGRAELRERLSVSLREDADSLMAALQSLAPGLPDVRSRAETLRTGDPRPGAGRGSLGGRSATAAILAVRGETGTCPHSDPHAHLGRGSKRSVPQPSAGRAR